MTDEEIYNAVKDILYSTGKGVSKRFPTLDPEEIDNVGWEYVYRSREVVIGFLTEKEQGRRYLGYRIRRAMLEWCGREMRAATGIDYRDTYTYTSEVIKELLSDVFEYENWQSAPAGEDNMPKSKRLVNEGGDRMAMLADVSRALKCLTDDQYNAIVWHYKYGYTHAMIGEEMDITENAVRLRIRRAVYRMVYFLAKQDPGGDEDDSPREFTGSRRVVSNATARARLDN